MLGEPALVAAEDGRDAQRQALLAEQRVAAVAAAVAPDRALLGEVHDVLHVGVARPRDVVLARRQRRADGVHARHERMVGAQHLDRGATHAGHDLHVHGDVGGVGDLHAELGEVGAERAHAERDHVHRAPAHAAVEQAVQDRLHLGRVHPVVGRTGVVGDARADERAILDAGDVARVGAGEKAVGPLVRIEPDERAGVDHLAAEPSYSSCDPSHQCTPAGLQSSTASATHCSSRLWRTYSGTSMGNTIGRATAVPVRSGSRREEACVGSR